MDNPFPAHEVDLRAQWLRLSDDLMAMGACAKILMPELSREPFDLAAFTAAMTSFSVTVRRFEATCTELHEAVDQATAPIDLRARQEAN